VEQDVTGPSGDSGASTFGVSIWFLVIATLLYLFPAYQGDTSNVGLRVGSYVLASVVLLLAIFAFGVALRDTPHVKSFVKELFGGLFGFSGLVPASAATRDTVQSLFGAALFLLIAAAVHGVLIWLIGLPAPLEAFVEVALLFFMCTFVAGPIINAVDVAFIKPVLTLLEEHSDRQTISDMARQVKRTVATVVFGLSAIIGLVVGLIELIQLFQ
jgi:hypothetical protein